MFFGRPKLTIGVFIILTLFMGLETYLHLAGFGSYPIYLLDSQIKYIPASNQSGVFLNRNHWFFNDRHMGNSDNWTRDIHPDVLLLGNSIVLGGNPYDHNESLGRSFKMRLMTNIVCGRSQPEDGPISMKWPISIRIKMSRKTPISS